MDVGDSRSLRSWPLVRRTCRLSRLGHVDRALADMSFYTGKAFPFLGLNEAHMPSTVRRGGPSVHGLRLALETGPSHSRRPHAQRGVQSGQPRNATPLRRAPRWRHHGRFDAPRQVGIVEAQSPVALSRCAGYLDLDASLTPWRGVCVLQSVLPIPARAWPPL